MPNRSYVLLDCLPFLLCTLAVVAKLGEAELVDSEKVRCVLLLALEGGPESRADRLIVRLESGEPARRSFELRNALYGEGIRWLKDFGASDGRDELREFVGGETGGGGRRARIGNWWSRGERGPDTHRRGARAGGAEGREGRRSGREAVNGDARARVWRIDCVRRGSSKRLLRLGKGGEEEGRERI